MKNLNTRVIAVYIVGGVLIAVMIESYCTPRPDAGAFAGALASLLAALISIPDKSKTKGRMNSRRSSAVRKR